MYGRIETDARRMMFQFTVNPVEVKPVPVERPVEPTG
jgi:hypothetical protein